MNLNIMQKDRLVEWFELLHKGDITKIEVELFDNGFVVMSAKYAQVE